MYKFLTLIVVSMVILMSCSIEPNLTSAQSIQHTYYVSVDGDDSNDGSLSAPFKTLQHAADVMQPGDTTQVRAGRYRETVNVSTSGLANRPIRFEAFNGEKVILDGTDLVSGDWQAVGDNIYKTTAAPIAGQFFHDQAMMTEARWPNRSFPEQLWDRSTWANASKGSRYGKMVDPALAKTGIDWTGAIAVLNVAHEFRTWTRPVKSHVAGSDSFTYEKDLPTITSYANSSKGWDDDRYYLVGKLAALDIEGEWYLDRETGEFYVYSKQDPRLATYRGKVRDYAFTVADKIAIEIAGFTFFATTVNLQDCTGCVVENNQFLYPVFAREFNAGAESLAQTLIHGQGNSFNHNLVSYAQIDGVVLQGPNNIANNNIVHDVAWSGQGTGIRMNGQVSIGSDISRNTVYNTGYSALRIGGKGPWQLSYNYAHTTCLASKDCAIVQTGSPKIAGARISYNWLHNAYASGKHPGGLFGGLGIRGDDQTRRLTVDHNVVWNIGRDGIIVKGNFNRVFNNTVFNIGSNGQDGNFISLHTEKEPYKFWRKQAPLLERQNLDTLAFNNIAFNIVGDRKRTPFEPNANLAANFFERALPLENPAQFRFAPLADSALIDAGVNLEGLVPNYTGKAPDIGAYEAGENWVPGADWTPANYK